MNGNPGWVRWRARITALALLLVLAGCASKPQKIVFRPVSRPMPQPVRYKASFDCTQSELPVQDLVCADDALAALDRDMAAAYRADLRSVDLVGRMQLIANQRRWLLGRAPLCKVQPARLGLGKPDLGQIACLKTDYAGRVAVLKAWPQPQAARPAQAGFHPLSAYVDFRPVDNRDPAVCDDFAKRFNDAIAEAGSLDFARMAGYAAVADSRGLASAVSDGHRYDIAAYDAGPYASYQMRAYNLSIDGQVKISDTALGEWIADLPNGGGRFSNVSSQTSDYGSIAVFRAGQRDYALVAEAWGYYSAAATGESAYAGLYDVSDGGAQPRCLYRTYLTPPVAGALDQLPAYKELAIALDAVSGDRVAGLGLDERRDESLLQRETEWILLNMPLVVQADAERYGRIGALRQRHDAALEALFQWSERNVPGKLHYRRVMPLIPPAHDELVAMFQHTQGLKPDEAVAAADLAVIDLVDRAAETLGDYATVAAAPLAPFSAYKPRYAAAPSPGDLERGRRIATLHSALLNRAGADVVADFIKYEFAAPDRPRGVGAAGDTALMAAVRTPEIYSLLLAAGLDVNAGNEWHKTPLMTAAQTNQLDTAKLLLDAGANVNATTVPWHRDGAGGLDNAEGAVGGRTALMYAAAGANADMLQLLLAHGADAARHDDAGADACAYVTRNSMLSEPDRAQLAALVCRAGNPVR